MRSQYSLAHQKRLLIASSRGFIASMLLIAVCISGCRQLGAISTVGAVARTGKSVIDLTTAIKGITAGQQGDVVSVEVVAIGTEPAEVMWTNAPDRFAKEDLNDTLIKSYENRWNRIASVSFEQPLPTSGSLLLYYDKNSTQVTFPGLQGESNCLPSGTCIHAFNVATKDG